MQRHFSDTQALLPTLLTQQDSLHFPFQQQQQLQLQHHVPPIPSRLNPALAGRRGDVPAALLGRGTVSMPSSPLRRAVALPWAEPNSAQTFFGHQGIQGDALSSAVDFDPFGTLPPPLIPLHEPAPAPPRPASFDMWSSDQTSQFSSPSVHGQATPLFSGIGTGNGIGSGSGDPFHIASSPTTLPHSAEVARPSPRATVSAFFAGDNGTSARNGISPASLRMTKNQYEYSSKSDNDNDTNNVNRNEGDDEDIFDELDNNNDNGSPCSGTGYSFEDGPMRRKKKRHQVRVACTHCQKACKKCSNTRPCERCIKYGLNDCVDSSRKARKSGVKRGPYKRRTSKFNHSAQFTDDHRSYSPENQSIEPSFREHFLNNDETIASRPHHLPPYAPLPDTLLHLRSIPSLDHPYPPPPHSPTLPAPKASRLESALSAALTGLDARPNWVNGQRVFPSLVNPPAFGVGMGVPGSVPGTLMPITPTVPFPLSLKVYGRRGGDDPFSRALSPIQGNRPKFTIPNSSATTTGFQHEVNGQAGYFPTINGLGTVEESKEDRAGLNSDTLDQTPSVIPNDGTSPNQPLRPDIFGTPLNEGMSGILPRLAETILPTSSTNTQVDIQPASAVPSSVSVGNQNQPATVFETTVPTTQQPLFAFEIPNATLTTPATLGTNEQLQSTGAQGNPTWHLNQPPTTTPTTIALRRIRKPTLRTLTVPGISRESSPVNGISTPMTRTGPLTGTWTPGLTISPIIEKDQQQHLSWANPALGPSASSLAGFKTDLGGKEGERERMSPMLF